MRLRHRAGKLKTGLQELQSVWRVEPCGPDKRRANSWIMDSFKGLFAVARRGIPNASLCSTSAFIVEGGLLVAVCFNAALALYLLGALVGLVFQRCRLGSMRASMLLALAGALLSAASSIAALLAGSAEWTIGTAIPLFPYSLCVDPLSAFFVLTLSILTTAVSIYSFGYLESMERNRNIGIVGSLLNGLLLSMMVVFSASNAYFFLIGWELMALTAYGLVTFEHESEESRNAGFLYLIMSHADAGCLLLGFGLLGHAANGLEFGALRRAGVGLSPDTQALAFFLFLIGFGIKAGIIPLHIWLPAAHPVAPSNASALLSGIVIKTGIYGIARVYFEFLGDLPLWAGTVVLSLAAISAILGVLYALMEHDLKRLLAYHSIENIGIILLGFGAALMFKASGHPSLAAFAVTAGLFHTLNHATFKCLLFLGAGAVQHAAHSRNMEHLGGLIRLMPTTAFCFLIGAISISGLPPLNGFVSEWLTYQSLLAGFGTTHTLMDLLFPVAGSLLALTGALAAACFVKAFGITFLALPRSDHARTATEVPFSMRAGMLILTASCFVFGIGASWFLPLLDGLGQQLAGATRPVENSHLFLVTAGDLKKGSVAPAVIAGLLALAALALRWFCRTWAKIRTDVPWDCGLPALGPQHEYTATAFSKPIRMVFAALFQPRRGILEVFDVSPYFPREVHFESEIEQPFEDRLYEPLKQLVFWISIKMRSVQAGSVHLYLSYVFVTLVALLIFTVRQTR
jgi:hydrogenase-4 component B